MHHPGQTAIGLLILLLSPSAAGLSIVEAKISDLQSALINGQINAVQLTAKHLHRLAQYDRRGPRLNAIPVLNLNIFEHAQESDDYRAINGSVRSQLEGIPGTLKDSYMMAGMTAAAGSPAFLNLTASEDAFTTGRLRNGGGLILGKTNMPPMANGGMQRGAYGRAESPYNKDFLTAAYASGSSNGAASSTSSSMAAFAMAEETVSSGRFPASNNGLVAYTPSRGILSIRENWPLFPIADVVVPYARAVEDLAHVLDVIVADDEKKTSDFWRGQPFVKLPAASSMRPNSYHSLLDANSLKGKRIGVPKMYIGENDPEAQPIWVSPQVRQLWQNARETLESLGAIVEEVGFPLVTKYEAPGAAAWETDYPPPGTTDNEALSRPEGLDSYSWDDFLRMIDDNRVSGLTSLLEVDPTLIFPQLPGTLQDRYGGGFMNRTEVNIATVESIYYRNGSIYEIPGVEAHLKALEAWRNEHLEQWMDHSELDALVWPSVGDVGPQDAETNNASAVLAWRNGVFFSNGNYAIRQFGVPTISVSMGLLDGINMPLDLTFASKAYDDNALLSYSYAFERAHKGHRIAPPRTPELPTDHILNKCRNRRSLVGSHPPKLTATAKRDEHNTLKISGSVDTSKNGKIESLEVFVDGVQLGQVQVDGNGDWNILVKAVAYDDPKGAVPVRFINQPDQGLAMVVVVATAKNGRSDGKLLFV